MHIIESVFEFIRTLWVVATVTVGALVLPAPATAPVVAPGPTDITPVATSPQIAAHDVEFLVDAPQVTVEAPTVIDVRLIGHQAEIDTCTGPVLSRYDTGDVIGEHNHCGGAWVLSLEVGDSVTITGYRAGTYTVTGAKSVPKGASISVLNFASLYVQTCYFHDDNMRLVGLEPA